MIQGEALKLLGLAACDCAEQALIYVPKNEDRPRKAIQAARDWCVGQASIEDVLAAADAAADAARDKSLQKSADLVRARIPWEIVEERAKQLGVI